ncbi:MAG: hypothetical protein E2O44_05750 [Nitrospina sp.]|nr:MAG: hypothetical protein E2O44_05750 [Nitrospina sp.]
MTMRLKIINTKFIFPGIVLIGLLGSCSIENSGVDGENDPNVVAIVNGEKILKQSLIEELRWTKRKYRVKKSDSLRPEEKVWLKTNTLNEMVRTVMLRQEAERQGISVSKSEFKTHLKKVKQGYQEDAFQRALEVEEISREQWQEKIRNNLLIGKVVNEVVNKNVSVGEEELLRYFENHGEEFQKGEQVHALHIVVETEDEAREILKLLRKRKSFSDLAEKRSLGLEASKGGDMGYFEAGNMPEEFDQVFKLEVNKVSDIIRTPYGVHVFKVVDKKPARKMNFEESRKKILVKLLQEAQENAFNKWQNKIKNNSKIIIKYETLEQIH